MNYVTPELEILTFCEKDVLTDSQTDPKNKSAWESDMARVPSPSARAS